MNHWVVWGGLADLVSLILAASAHLALRLASRGRMAEQFERAGKTRQLDALLAARPQLVLATGMVRSAMSLALVLFVLALLDGEGVESFQVRYVTAFGGALLLTVVFGVAIPTAWVKYSGEKLLVRMAPLLFAARAALYPFVWLLGATDPFVRRLIGVPDDRRETPAEDLEREILNVVSEGEKRGAVDEQEKEMIESVIELRDTEVHQVMTPRTDIVAIAQGTELHEVKRLIAEHGHSRMPVYQGTIDEVVGVLYAKDLLQLDSDTPFDIEAVMRPALFIPEAKPVRDLLREFQQQKIHIAVILDEYGGTAGLVTIEDILEELVGEIVDEYEPPEPQPLVRIDERTVEVDARMRIDDLNDELDIELPEDDGYETIGGFVFSSLGRIPKIGESLEHGRVSIDVIAAEPRKINRLKLQITPVQDNGRTES